MVRLKFVVSKKGEYLGYANNKPGQKVGSVEMYPVTDGSEENKKFYAATPSGRLEFGTINEAALDMLPLGAECYISIEVVKK